MAKKFVVKPENGKVAVLVDGTEIDRYMAYNKKRGKEDGESNISRPSDPSPGTVSRAGDDHGGGSCPTGGV